MLVFVSNISEAWTDSRLCSDEWASAKTLYIQYVLHIRSSASDLDSMTREIFERRGGRRISKDGLRVGWEIQTDLYKVRMLESGSGL